MPFVAISIPSNLVQFLTQFVKSHLTHLLNFTSHCRYIVFSSPPFSSHRFSQVDRSCRSIRSPLKPSPRFADPCRSCSSHIEVLAPYLPTLNVPYIPIIIQPINAFHSLPQTRPPHGKLIINSASIPLIVLSVRALMSLSAACQRNTYSHRSSALHPKPPPHDYVAPHLRDVMIRLCNFTRTS